MTEQGRLRVAIAGCHRQLNRTPGSHNWATGFDAVPETQIVAVFDRGAETRQQFIDCWGAMPQYDDYEAMLAAEKPDIVCIATRQTMHADQIEQAVAAGVRGIMCDKPLATSLGEMDRIVAACRAGKVPLTFGLDRRWHPTYRFARELLAGGAVGKVTAVIGYSLQNLINHGCHWYDVLLALAGDPEVSWVSGHVVDLSALPADARQRQDPNGRLTIGLANGVTASVQPEGGPGLAFEVVGTTGRILLLNDARNVYLWEAAEVDGRPQVRPQEVTLPVFETGWPAGPAMVRDIVSAVRGGPPTGCDVEQARRATEIGFAAHVSDRLGGARVNPATADRSLRIESFVWGNE